MPSGAVVRLPIEGPSASPLPGRDQMAAVEPSRTLPCYPRWGPGGINPGLGGPVGRNQPVNRGGCKLAGIGDLFINEEGSELLEQRIAYLGQTVAEIYTAKLARDFPERRFIVSIIDEEDEYAVTFCQE
jgi:hypothetical protein